MRFEYIMISFIILYYYNVYRAYFYLGTLITDSYRFQNELDGF